MEKKLKTGGRQKGTVNKTSAQIREAFQELVSNNIDKLNEDIASLLPEQRLRFIIDLSKFVVPVLKATDLNIGTNEGTKINIINLGPGINPEEDK